MKKLGMLVMVMFGGLVFADTADDVQAKLNAIKSMSASFSQVVKAGKRNISSSQGVMALNRPGRFRWQTKSPMEQLVIADGKKLWIYDVELEQVTVKKQEKGMGGTPALFLSGYDDTVARDFEVAETSTGGSHTYDLHAKSTKENYQRVKLTFQGDTLSVIEFFDQLGQHTTVRLSNIKNNLKLTDNMFQFKAPKGVDVISQ